MISTGGGAVTARLNWGSFQSGIVVYLDVPVEVLAQRVAADGVSKRPLVGQGNEDAADPYAKTLIGLAGCG